MFPGKCTVSGGGKGRGPTADVSSGNLENAVISKVTERSYLA